MATLIPAEDPVVCSNVCAWLLLCGGWVVRQTNLARRPHSAERNPIQVSTQVDSTVDPLSGSRDADGRGQGATVLQGCTQQWGAELIKHP